MANFIENNKNLLENKTLLEVGAGCGVPSLVACINGAKRIVVTDYPGTYLLYNLI